jgi:hypothetical protein
MGIVIIFAICVFVIMEWGAPLVVNCGMKHALVAGTCVVILYGMGLNMSEFRVYNVHLELLWWNGILMVSQNLPKPTQLTTLTQTNPAQYHYLLVVIVANCGHQSIVWLAVLEHSVPRVLRVWPVQRVAIVGHLKCPLPHRARLVHMGH